ncbi:MULTISPECIES: polysaccharide biosynthesis/export family protein [Maribacter]|uniref:Polysaccharide biosynthesis/export family protein n=1 Tax=Maribacter flavus TaxID=1658664 RepID=A0ABU7IJF5_9FLAO|nr:MULTISPECIES: polysaccharide biosynthesis/export family protein [Maribacter]MDC6405698.1 polysaccharide export protein [Maribacter sp. PR66]MEE1973050.1 polysaccharide biosynthesis/export family protein [Maribacter flavus]
MSKFLNFLRTALLFIVAVAFITSCGSRKDIVYFQDARNYETIVSDNNHNYSFKVDDIVRINVSTLDQTASAPFNIFMGVRPESNLVGINNGGMQPSQLDYIVDKNGEIDFPVLGRIKILGLTPEETRELLKEKLKPYLKDPIINIRLVNFTVTLLGEVARPGTYQIIGEQVTVLEAIGLAGDLTIKGKRDNVMVVRDFNGSKVYTRIDLTKKEALNSPVYYLTQNDVVYVEPNRSAVSQSTLDNRAGLAVSIASLLITTTVIILTRN